jgi:hypothetical protein
MKAALDKFEPGKGIPSCVLEARPLCEDFPEFLYEITLIGIKPPGNTLTLRLYSNKTPRRGNFYHMHVGHTEQVNTTGTKPSVL